MSKYYDKLNIVKEIDKTFKVNSAEDLINKEIATNNALSLTNGLTIIPKKSLTKYSIKELQQIANSKGYDFLPYTEYMDKYEKHYKNNDNRFLPYSDSYIFCKKH